MPRERRAPGFAATVSLLAFGFTLMSGVSWSVVNGAYILAARFGWAWLGRSAVSALLVSDGAIYLAGLPFLLLLGRFVPSGGPLPLRPQKPLTVGCFARLGCITYAASYLVSMMTDLLLTLVQLLAGGGVTTHQVAEVLEGLPPLRGFLLVAVVPAVGEELVFRGYLYKKLIRFGEGPYILLSGFWFGTYHGNFEQFLYAFAVGCCLAYLVCRTGSMAYGMLLHFLMNFISISVLQPLEGNRALSALAGCAVVAVIGMGVGFFVQLRRGLRFDRAPALPARAAAAGLLNPGMLTWLIFFALMAVLSLIS